MWKNFDYDYEHEYEKATDLSYTKVRVLPPITDTKGMNLQVAVERSENTTISVLNPYARPRHPHTP